MSPMNKAIDELEKELSALAEMIAETKKRLPAHSAKPPLMMELLDLEDRYDAVMKQIEKLKSDC